MFGLSLKAKRRFSGEWKRIGSSLWARVIKEGLGFFAVNSAGQSL